MNKEKAISVDDMSVDSDRRPAREGGTVDCDYVVYRLEEAGTSLLALPNSGFTTAMRQSSLDVVRAAVEGYGWSDRQVRPPVPSAEKITRMDEALRWMSPDPARSLRAPAHRRRAQPREPRHGALPLQLAQARYSAGR